MKSVNHTNLNDQSDCANNSKKEMDINNRDKLQYLLTAYNELRNELKIRIQQRDNLSIQFIVSFGVLLGITFTNYDYAYFAVLIIPIMTIFFFIQIYSSYNVHDRLVEFIRTNIGEEIGKLLEINEKDLHNYFWEHYCKVDRDIHNIKTAGGRKEFFTLLIRIVPAICSLIFFFKSYSKHDLTQFASIAISVISIFVYYMIGGYYLFKFNKLPKRLENQRLSACDYRKKYVNTRKKQKAVFFDRDGTIHVDKVETTLEKGLELFPDTIKVFKKLKKKGYRIIIVTNQSGIAKGHITLDQMHKFNKKLRKTVAHKLCFIDAIYYCPHKQEDNCGCMKPKTGMFERAVREFNIDINKSYLIGDKTSDIKAAKNAGIARDHCILVTTGLYDNNDYRTEPDLDTLQPNICGSLSEAYNKIQ